MLRLAAREGQSRLPKGLGDYQTLSQDIFHHLSVHCCADEDDPGAWVQTAEWTIKAAQECDNLASK